LESPAITYPKEPIQIARWCDSLDDGTLVVASGPRLLPMCNSDGTGTPLVKEAKFGADVIRFGPRQGVGNHVHEGAHILFVIKGEGWVDYEGMEHRLEPGLCYFVPGLTQHAIRADTELVLIAVGNDHRALDSVERMEPVSVTESTMQTR
jgi:quercetin dioxygenase-like cupin family protein